MWPKIGKLVGDNLYLHRQYLEHLPEELRETITQAQRIAAEAFDLADVFKIGTSNRTVSLLRYPSFFEAPFPALTESWRIHLDSDRVSYRSYTESLNPPILHRKELLLPPNHPDRETFATLTAQAEQLGLFSDNHLIGFMRSWDDKIRAAGYHLDGHTLVPLGNDLSEAGQGALLDTTGAEIQRHRTALSRAGLSAPMQALARHGLLGEKTTLFDYGCGRGDDLTALRNNGIAANCWDPYFAPDQKKRRAKVVNLGFVINVIEDFDERIAALRGAFELAEELLGFTGRLLQIPFFMIKQSNDMIALIDGHDQRL